MSKIEEKLDKMLEIIQAQQKEIDTLKVKKVSHEKRTVAQAKDLLPYGEKTNILKAMMPTELSQMIPKSDYCDKGFNLDKGDMIKFFESHSLGGNPWITYPEQIQFFIVPLKAIHKPTKTQWNKKLKLMTGQIETSIVKATTQLKENEKSWNERKVKSQNYRIASLQNVLTKISEI